MTRALWLLLRLRLKAFTRRIVRNVQTVRGALLTAFFGMLMVFWLGGLIIHALVMPRTPGATASAEQVERFGPLALFAYCVGIIFISGRQQAPLQFTLPEVQFLFAGPFSRRQILTYKLLSQFLLTLPVSLFLSFAARQVAGAYMSGLVAAVLIFAFLQLYGTALAMITCMLDEWTFSRARRVILLLVGAAVLVAAVVGWRASGGADDPVETLLRIEKSDIVQYGLLPLRWFARTLTAQSLGPLLLNGGLALGVNLLLLALVYGLDAQFLEVAAGAAEKRYALVEKMRRGGLTGMAGSRTGRVRYRLANPPWLGGIGPIAWRQFISAFRSRRILGVLIFTTLMGSIGPIIAILTNKRGMDEAMPWTLAVMGLFMSTLLSQTVAFDFRSDIDRMEVLKGLPIASWRIVVGQLVTPVFCISIYQILLCALVYLTLGQIGMLLLFTTVLAWPVNLLLTGIDNLLFLLFPTRMAAQNPGDFSHAGRQMLLFMGKGLAVAVALGFPAAFGGIAYALSDRNWGLTLLAAAVPAYLICALPVPLTTMAFNRFDVARDTPP